MAIRCLWACLAVWLLAGASAAATPFPSPWRIVDHPVDTFVFDVVQTPDGTIWIATEGGLRRFDNERFVAVDHPLLKGAVEALAVDQVGTLWVARRGHPLARLHDGHIDEDLPSVPGTPAFSPQVFFRDATGTLWNAGTAGLRRRTPDSWQSLALPTQLVPEQAKPRSWLAGNGDLWLGSDTGWWRLADRAGVMDLVTHTVGLRARQTSDGLHMALGSTAASLPASLYDSRLEAWCRDRRGLTWIATDRGLVSLDGNHVTTFAANEGLTDAHVTRVFEDQEGNLWIVTHGGRLAEVQPVAIASVAGRQGLPGNTPFGIAEDRTGTLWVTTVRGLARIDESGIQPIVVPQLPQSALRSLAITSAGDLILGTLSPEWIRFDPRSMTVTRQPLPDPVSLHEHLTTIAETAGQLWMGTSQGRLFHLDRNGLLVAFVAPGSCNGVRDDIGGQCPHSIAVLRPEAAGTLIVATYAGELFRIDTGSRLERLWDARAVALALRDVLELEPGIHLLATDAGLLVAGGGSGQQLSLRRATDDSFGPVFRLLVDTNGSLWLGGLRGVARMKKSDLHSFIETAGSPEPRLRRFSTADGLPSNIVMSQTTPSALTAVDGRLWFVTVGGLAAVSPAKLDIPPARPLIEAVEGNDDQMEYPFGMAVMNVPPGRGELLFRYMTSATANRHAIQYEYRLDGFDDRWHQAGGRRLAHYTNITPGRYRFRVRATTEGEAPPHNEATVTVTLQPRFLQTGTFKLLLVAGALLALAMLFAARGRQLRARFAAILEERHRIARDLHDSLAQVFAALALQIETIRLTSADQPRATFTELDRLRKMVAHGRRASRAVIWNLRSEGGHADSLPQGLRDLTGLYEGARVTLDLTGRPFALPLAVESEVLMVVQQAVANAVEHGQAHHVSVEIEYGPGRRLIASVRDDGSGFDAQAALGAGHIGLAAMNERATRAGGILTVETVAGAGTEVRLVIAAVASSRGGS